MDNSREPIETPPDLSDSDTVAAYRAELRGVGGWARQLGFALVMVAVFLFIWPKLTGQMTLLGLPVEPLGWAVLAVAWLFLIYTMVARWQHHPRRMGD